MTSARRQQINAAASQVSKRGADVDGNKRSAGMQTQMRLGPAGNAFEHEADRVAERIMATPFGHEREVGQQPVVGPLVQRHAAGRAASGWTSR